jgi:uncharacterized protein YbcC (UPF0753/DUF2309 family)
MTMEDKEMSMSIADQVHDLDRLFASADAAARAIPPAWPLAASVAVNPFLGQADRSLADTAALLARVAGARITMPRAWYRARIASGAIRDVDLAAAIDAAAAGDSPPPTLARLRAAVAVDTPAPAALPTVADLAARVSGIDWPAVIAERFGAWAGAYFDEGQALWAAPRGKSAYAAWRAVATHDLTPEIVGLRGFAAFVADLPDASTDAMISAAARLGLGGAAMPTYFHRLLTTLGGWAHTARYRLWQAQLAGSGDDTITDFLCIRMLWEDALLEHYAPRIAADWTAALADYARPVAPDMDQRIDAILQDASERAAQRRLAETLAAPAAPRTAVAPAMQAAFCIDVRSEVFRRALESIDPAIRTLGFAGFFGLTASHRRFGSDVAEHRLPVLLNPGLASTTTDTALIDADRTARFRHRAARAWGRFKLAAVSSFAFVEAAGPAYVVKLVRDAIGVRGGAGVDAPAPRLDPMPDPADRVTMAATVLRAMSLTDGFAPLVLLVGHGANVVNNPHASALHCGACGGYPGDVNARLLAALLNDPVVRDGLADQGIAIPADTRFVAALHDTTTDAVQLFADDEPATPHSDRIDQARAWLARAGALARGERALRLPGARHADAVSRRSRDWAQTRPEWALAGCQAFIAAPRERTAGRDLAGRAFLHDYDWHQDTGFKVLELILTAPVVVASWISLQYYGSAVAPALFGGGNKLLHNVIGGMGVVEGNGGVLRAGLPWQSVHDGTALMHEPLRLTVCIAAPIDAITAVLERHPDVRALFDNGWLHLFALDDQGRMTARYRPGLAWEAAVDAPATPARETELA